MKIAIVAGTRPEVVKLAPVHAALNLRPGFQSIWVSTEQQGALNSQTLGVMAVAPDLRLRAPSPDRSLAGRFTEVMERLDDAFALLRPDMVLVQGDTSTTAAGAMAAFARQIPIGHVEAGLRTFDLDSPFPEEGWRCVVGQLAAVHFAPTQKARSNLLHCGVADEKVHVTGNTGIDSIRLTAGHIPPAPITDGLRQVLVTLHRRENWGDALGQVLDSLTEIRDGAPDVEIVFVTHANPDLRSRVHARLDGQPRIRVVEPLDYTAFVAQLKSACLVLSDSGGVQEEAPVLGAPVLVLREATERMEAVEAGVARLVGVSRPVIVKEALRLLTNEAERMDMVRIVSPFGDGHASERIADILQGLAACRPTQTAAAAAV